MSAILPEDKLIPDHEVQQGAGRNRDDVCDEIVQPKYSRQQLHDPYISQQ